MFFARLFASDVGKKPGRIIITPQSKRPFEAYLSFKASMHQSYNFDSLTVW